jgi:hypothetical protein
MKRLAALPALAVVIAVGATAAPTLACFGGIIEVAQPLADPEGILVRVVSFSRNCVPTLVVPGYEVEFVAEPSFVRCEGKPDTAENLNAASFLGIRTDIDPFHGRTSRLLGDTLHVMIDLTAIPSMTEDLRRRLNGWSIDDVIKATAESVLLTAYWHRRGVSAPDSLGRSHSVYAQYVWLEIHGPEQYLSLGGVFNTDYLDSLSRSHWR